MLTVEDIRTGACPSPFLCVDLGLVSDWKDPSSTTSTITTTSTTTSTTSTPTSLTAGYRMMMTTPCATSKYLSATISLPSLLRTSSAGGGLMNGIGYSVATTVRIHTQVTLVSYETAQTLSNHGMTTTTSSSTTSAAATASSFSSSSSSSGLRRELIDSSMLLLAEEPVLDQWSTYTFFPSGD